MLIVAAYSISILGQVLFYDPLKFTLPDLVGIEMLVGIAEYYIGPVDAENPQGDDGEKDVESIRSPVKGIGGIDCQRRSLFVKGN